MNLEEAKKEYFKYLSNYEMTIFDLKRRAEHSIRVMDISKQIAENLELDTEKVDLAMLIGLLHDIARYEEYTKKHIEKSDEQIDHGDLGVEILTKDKYIRRFIEEDKYDNIILKAIKNHNKFEIEDGLTEEELFFSKLIRDADKIDIFYECVEKFWIDKKDVEESCISEDVINDFRNYDLIKNEKVITPLDYLIVVLAFIFDINFEFSFEIIKQEKCLEKMIEMFNFENNEIAKKQIEEVKEILNNYIQEQINKKGMN